MTTAAASPPLVNEDAEEMPQAERLTSPKFRILHRTSDLDSAQDYLAMGASICTVFMLLAWLLCVTGFHPEDEMLSLMGHNWNSAEGKCFYMALVGSAILLLKSRFHYLFPNMVVRREDGTEIKWIPKLYSLGIFGIMAVGVMPITDVMGGVNNHFQSAVGFQIHMVSITLAFAGFIICEFAVLTRHRNLHQDELIWRIAAFGCMFASIGVFQVNDNLLKFNLFGGKAEYLGWRLRFELLIVASLVWILQVVWAFSFFYKEEESGPEPVAQGAGSVTLYAFPYQALLWVAAVFYDLKIHKSCTIVAIAQGLCFFGIAGATFFLMQRRAMKNYPLRALQPPK